MNLGFLLHALIPSLNSVSILVLFFGYLAVAGSTLPGKAVPRLTLQDGSRLYYRCNGLLSLLFLVCLLGVGANMGLLSPTVISERGFELLSTTFIFSVLVSLVPYAAGCNSQNQSSSLKPHVTGSLIHDWWFVIQLNPQFVGIDLKLFFVRAGMMGWLFINLSVLAKSIQDAKLRCSMSLTNYSVGYNRRETVFMLVFGDLVWNSFTFSIQGWWLLANKAELKTAAVIANSLVFLVGYLVFRGANKQKHVFKKNPKALIRGKPPRVIGGKLLASGYCSPVPYFYPLYLLILPIWRERSGEARCAEKYKEVWAEYSRLVPWRILPYFY
ncbi:hypothetical protein P3X46_009578 [Hevea brasiliensis]|uniref:Steroid 5-alpha reductase C-terminal domain-containing protein n=1 Tax=Hevea brasiliensis TaxID=3981 RepID=A0ABQ9MQR1_HEVBR|nr:hypothetical protein P3X46_009578 [Hevea brasiliensis]